MKKTAIFICISIILSCSKNATNDDREILLSYPEKEVTITFTNAGSIAPDSIVWNGKSGTYSISSSSDILQQDIISFDTLTGELSWGIDFPIGSYNFIITAQSEGVTATAEIILTNRFLEGFFEGGLQEGVDPDDPFNITVLADYGLGLNQDGSISMEKYSNPGLLFSGNWKISENGILVVEYLTNFSGGVYTYMSGTISYGDENKLPRYRGFYGSSLDEFEAIENPEGIFTLRWD